jgi:hypothetical protein
MNNENEISAEKPAFDPVAEVAKMRASEPAGRSGPKLSRIEQCQALAVLKVGHFSHGVVQKMFDLSPASVSNLANCTARKAGRSWHYPAVFQEWRRLGEEAFLRAYMTEELWLKAKRLKYETPAPLDNRTLRGSNFRADSKSYDRIGFFEVSDWVARVDWAECDPETPEELRGPIGWRYATQGRGALSPYLSQDPTEDEPRWMPWRTSGDAFDAAYQAAGLVSPRFARKS